MSLLARFARSLIIMIMELYNYEIMEPWYYYNNYFMINFAQLFIRMRANEIVRMRTSCYRNSIISWL